MGRAGATVVAGATDSLTSKLDPETARKLGDEHLEDELSEHPRCRDGRLVGRITRLWNEVARAAAVDPASCTVTVTEDETVNVYAFVGRNVVFTTGFANFAGGDDEMICFVLAHELGHIELGHTDLPYRRAEAAGTIGPLGQLSHMAAERIAKDSPMNQSQEYDADCYAARTVRKAGRSTEGAVRFFNRIEQERPSGGSGDTLLGALFGSHPDSARRIDHVRTGCP